MKQIVNSVMLPHKNKKIVLSVSGGVDSLVLFQLLMDLEYSFVVVHFNHQQRLESKHEALYLEKLCQDGNIEFEYVVLAIDEKENFQSAAHKMRRKHLLKVAKKYETDIIVTAHHLNDLAETVLLKLSRGSNLLGYSGIQQSYYKDNAYFVKPLLQISKTEIINYAKANNIYYFEDQTNISDNYQRNKIRHHVIPYLIAENPAFLKKIIQFNETLVTAFEYLRKSTITFLKGEKSFLISEFKTLDLALQRDIISYLLEEYKLIISTQKIDSIISFLDKAGPNATFSLGQNKQLKKVYNKALIEKKSPFVPFRQQLYLDGLNILPTNGLIVFENNFGENQNNEIILCYNKIALPLWARNREAGDKLYFPYGHKKLKDFYIDKKVPKKARDNDIIITDNNNQILAVLGRYYNNNPNLKDTIKLRYRSK